MVEVDEFLGSVLPRLRASEVALHQGDAQPRKAAWSSEEPVTLFGAEVERTGRAEIEATFDWVASRFEGCRSFDYEVVAAGAPDGLGYVVAYEHVTATVAGTEVSYLLRSTTVFRREGGDWYVVHRHGDPARRT